MTVKTQGGKVITKDGKVSCSCCDLSCKRFCNVSTWTVSLISETWPIEVTSPVDFEVYVWNFPLFELDGSTLTKDESLYCEWSQEYNTIGDYEDENVKLTNLTANLSYRNINNPDASTCRWRVRFEVNGTIFWKFGSFEEDYDHVEFRTTPSVTDTGPQTIFRKIVLGEEYGIILS